MSNVQITIRYDQNTITGCHDQHAIQIVITKYANMAMHDWWLSIYHDKLRWQVFMSMEECWIKLAQPLWLQKDDKPIIDKLLCTLLIQEIPMMDMRLIGKNVHLGLLLAMATYISVSQFCLSWHTCSWVLLHCIVSVILFGCSNE